MLPAGLSLNPTTGAITGTPTAAGAYDFTITVSNGVLPDLVKQFTGDVVAAPAWTDNTIAAAFQVGVAVNDGVAASGTPAPTYSVSAGTSGRAVVEHCDGCDHRHTNRQRRLQLHTPRRQRRRISGHPRLLRFGFHIAGVDRPDARHDSDQRGVLRWR